MNALTTLYELLFVPAELVLTRRLEKPLYLSSAKTTFATQEAYAMWLKNQIFRLDADFQIASTIGLHRRIERIQKAQLLLRNELASLHTPEQAGPPIGNGPAL